MAREQWAKIDVDMPTDEKLFGRPLLERHLWTCLICLSKKQKLETGDFTIYNFDAAALSVRFNLGSPKGVEKGLEYFETCKPRPMISRKDGAIFLVNFEKRQAPVKDTPNAARERQRRKRERDRESRVVTGSVTGDVTGGHSRNGNVTCHAEGELEEEEEKDLECRGEEIPIAQGSETPSPAPPDWDSVLLDELRQAFPEAAFRRFLSASHAFPREQREAAAHEFLNRGLAAEGKGMAYLLAMIRDGAGKRSNGHDNGGKAAGNPSSVPKWKQMGASSEEEYAGWVTAAMADANGT